MMDGKEYRAYRTSSRFGIVVHCELIHPEDYVPGRNGQKEIPPASRDFYCGPSAHTCLLLLICGSSERWILVLRSPGWHCLFWQWCYWQICTFCTTAAERISEDNLIQFYVRMPHTGGAKAAHNTALSVNDAAEDAVKGIPAGQECVQ